MFQKKRLYLNAFFMVFILFSLKTFAQRPELPTPNAAAMNISTQYPASSFTGVPAINIPVLNFSYCGLDLSLNLSYNTNLVKPYNYASWVGLGWNLSSGGAISRTVNDKPDDYNYYGEGVADLTKDLNIGFYYNYAFHNSNWTDGNRLKDAMTDYINYEKKNQLYVTVKDYAPDEFSFNVADLSGSFYLDEFRNWKVKCNVPVKVVINPGDFYTVAGRITQGLPQANPIQYPPFTFLDQIMLIDQRGIKYVFGSALNSKESPSDRGFNTWHITKIIFPNQKSITYTYEKVSRFRRFSPVTCRTDGNGGNYVGMDFDFNFYAPVYIRTIKTEDQQIDFYRSTNPNEFAKLDSVKLSNLYNKEIKKVSFTYQNSTLDRLKLLKFEVKGSQDEVKEKYSFSYNSLSFVKTTSRTDGGYYTNFDHWGYYTTKVIGTPTFQASKDADTAVCRAELLNSITYPTKGYTVYTWEPNQVSKVINANRDQVLNHSIYVGGVRIKQITQFNDLGTQVDYKRYDYGNNYNPGTVIQPSSGVLYSYAEYRGYPTQYAYVNYLSAHLPLMENNVGSHVAYTKVTEISSDGSYKTTEFSNFDNGNSNEYMDEQPLAYQYSRENHKYYTSHSHERGYPLRVISYSNLGTPVNEKIFSYIRTGAGNEYVRAYMGGIFENQPIRDVAGNPIAVWWEGSAVKFYYNSYLLSQEINFDYSPNSAAVRTQTNHSYNSDRQMVSSWTANSLGLAREVINYYPKDMVAQNRDPYGVYAQMVADNNVSPVIETITKVNGIQTQLQQTEYRAGSQSPSHPALPYKQYSQVGYGALRTMVDHYEYDTDGNFLSEQRPGGMVSSYVYAYHNSMPVAKVINAANRPVSYQQDAINLPANYLNSVYNRTINLSGSDLRFKLEFDSRAENGSASIYCELIGPGGYSKSFVLGKGGALELSSISDIQEYHNLIPGSYSLMVHWDKRVELTSNMKVKIFAGTSNQYTDVFVENFEESGTFGNAHSGAKLNEGAYQLNFHPLSSGSFRLDYFYRSNGQWYYTSEAYNGPRTILPPGADAIDDVRVYPLGSQVMSYTYNVLAGMSSQIDHKGYTTFYEYDNFQRLYRVKDASGRILKQYCYNFAGEQTNCMVVPQPVPLPGKRPFYSFAELSNVIYHSTNGSDYISIDNYEMLGSLKLKLYANAACTAPYASTTDTDVDLEWSYTYTDYYGQHEDPPFVLTYTIPAGSAELDLGGNWQLKSVNTYDDPYYGTVTTGYVLRFRIVPRTGSNYEALPTTGAYY